ncbi:MAG TPA: DUF4112 domain-containing protein, partial [Luteitalea sp.]|nr:DUF4112 domain-containing protein [Luteitalea sp.]
MDEREARANILEQDRQLERLRHWSYLLDQVFRIPGTNVRFGWDVIVGLIPGFGDLSSPLFGVLIVVQAYRMGVPRIVQARMVINAIVDALLGVVPGLGNVADIFWRANTWNMRLLERHARPGVPHSPADAVFVGSIVGLLLVLAVLPVVLGRRLRPLRHLIA